VGAPASPRKPGAPPATATKSPELVSPAAAAAGRGAPGRRRADNGHRPVGLRHPTSPNRPHACTNSGKTAGTATTPPENRGSTGHHNQISRVSVVWPRRRRRPGRRYGPRPGTRAAETRAAPAALLQHGAARRRRLQSHPSGDQHRDQRRMPHRAHGDSRGYSVRRARPDDGRAGVCGEG